jgi:ATP-dependent Clp protease ATP-binding subunit ClpA
MNESTQGAEVAMTPRMQRIMRRAMAIAQDVGVPVVGTEHFTIALLEDARAMGTQVIAEQCDVTRIRERLNVLIASPEYRGRRE